MNFLVLFIIFLFGAIIGSFLNVVALRYGTGKGLGGRSMCFSCSKKLSFFELIPVLSFLILRGRCYGCKSRFSAQYLFVEIITGLVFMLTFLKSVTYTNPVFMFSFFVAVFSILIVIAIYDLRHMIIPDFLVFLFGIFSFIFMISQSNWNDVFSFPGFLNLFSGLIIALPFALLWLVSQGRWIGLGDAKLSIGIGYLLGFSGGLSAVTIGIWVGAVFSVLGILVSKFSKKILNRRLSFKSEVPLAPFLIFGLFVEFLFNFDLFHINILLSLF